MDNSQKKPVPVPADPTIITDIDLKIDWTEHLEAVYPLIKENDRRAAQAMADARYIVVTNETRQK